MTINSNKYFIIFALLTGVSIVAFANSYLNMLRLNTLTARANTIHNTYQNLSKEIYKAAIINPKLLSVKNTRDVQIFYTDSLKILEQLALLQSTVNDAANVDLTRQLNIKIKEEISWILSGNVPDSILLNQSTPHLASFYQIDSLLVAGIKHTSNLQVKCLQQLDKNLSRLLLWIIILILLLFLTTVGLFTQQQKRRKKERELIKSEKRFKALIENNHDIATLYDESLRLIYRSPSSTRLTGWTDADMKDIDGITKIHTDDRENMQQIIAASIANPGKAFPYLFRYLHKNGNYIWLEGTATKLVKKDDIYGLVFNSRDVTERVALEQLLKKANTLARIGSWEVDMLKQTVYWSDITREIHETENNYQPDLATGINFYKQGSSRDLITKKVNEAIESGKLWDEELLIVTGKNNERWIRTIGEAEFVNGQCKRLYGSFQDIDQRRKAEERIIESEKKFRSLIENSAEGITLTDAFSNVTYRSPGSYKITGNLPTDQAINLTHPDDLPAIKNTLAEILQSPGIPTPFQGRFLHQSGNYIWLEGTFTNLLDMDGVNAIVTNYRDITKRKELEEQLYKSNVLARIGSWEINMVKATVYLSDIAREIHETEIDFDPGLTAGINFYKAGYSRNTITQKIDDAVEFAKPWDEELQIVTAKNNERWVRSIGEARFVNGICVKLYGSLQDIDVRKKAEQKIKDINVELEEKVLQRTKELQEANSQMEAFSYSISHDLRAPLRAIIGYTSMLEEDYAERLDQEARRITTVIKNNTLKMSNLIDDLLNFSRMGRQQLIKTHVNSSQLVSEIVADMENGNGYHPVEWMIAALPFINADPKTLKQVWINLISNAVKYSGKNPYPKIEIGTFHKDGQVVFFVKDNGVGFDENYKDKLFKVFQRLHSAEEFEGTGVGLAIVEKIVSRHGGKVWAEGILNKGASFYFSLPASEMAIAT